MAKPDTILAWYRRLIAQNFDGSRHRSYPGRPRIDSKLEALIIEMAQENISWGYDRIAGALANLDYEVSDQTVGNVLERPGFAPAPKRSNNTTWKEFIRRHMAVMAGIEVLTWRGLVTYHVLFFVHLESRRVCLPGLTRYSDQAWMEQMARTTDEIWGFLDQRRYALHDRDAKFRASFRATLASGGIKPIQLPARSPNLNAHAERWVRSVKEECLGKLILFGGGSLRRALTEFADYFHSERTTTVNAMSLCSRTNQPKAAPEIDCGAKNVSVVHCGSTPTPHEFFGRSGYAGRFISHSRAGRAQHGKVAPHLGELIWRQRVVGREIRALSHIFAFRSRISLALIRCLQPGISRIWQR